MISSMGLSDTGIRKMITVITHIYMQKEFHDLLKELEQIYCQAGEQNYLIMAFEDALYTMLQQSQELISEEGFL